MPEVPVAAWWHNGGPGSEGGVLQAVPGSPQQLCPSPLPPQADELTVREDPCELCQAAEVGVAQVCGHEWSEPETTGIQCFRVLLRARVRSGPFSAAGTVGFLQVGDGVRGLRRGRWVELHSVLSGGFVLGHFTDGETVLSEEPG